MNKKNAPQTKGSDSSLSKFVAQAGIASRRKVTELIKNGLISVNGTVIREPGYKLKPTDKVQHQNKPVRIADKMYILLNKPKNFITTASDEKGRKTVMDLVIGIKERLYPVGRLDRDTTGLLLLTNDGNLAQRLAHPRYEMQKIYAVTLNRIFSKEDMAEIKKGIYLSDGFIRIDAIKYAPEARRNQVIVTLHSGKNRIIRRIFHHLGYDVIKLDRIRYGTLTKKGLPVGQWRYLTDPEIESLLR